MSNPYQPHVDKGDITAEQAEAMASVRLLASATAGKGIAAAGGLGEPFAFGMLDAIAVRLTHWYGGDKAAEVLRHYADVCGDRAEKDAANGG